jgi:hypothetical protein
VAAKPPGTVANLYIMWDRLPVEARPAEGDLLRSEPGGSCYRIDEVRTSRRDSDRVNYRVTRLGRDAVAADAPGVFTFRWLRRERRR